MFLKMITFCYDQIRKDYHATAYSNKFAARVTKLDIWHHRNYPLAGNSDDALTLYDTTGKPVVHIEYS